MKRMKKRRSNGCWLVKEKSIYFEPIDLHANSSCCNFIIQKIKFKRKIVKFMKYKHIAIKILRVGKFPNVIDIRQEK